MLLFGSVQHLRMTIYSPFLWLFLAVNLFGKSLHTFTPYCSHTRFSLKRGRANPWTRKFMSAVQSFISQSSIRSALSGFLLSAALFSHKEVDRSSPAFYLPEEFWREAQKTPLSSLPHLFLSLWIFHARKLISDISLSSLKSAQSYGEDLMLCFWIWMLGVTNILHAAFWNFG